MQSTVTIVRLRSMPVSERREELETMIVSVLKSALLMGEDEELSTSESFFDLGLTSLALTESKEHLESLLGCRISATVLFNSPTIDSLAEHLAGEVLPELFTGEPSQKEEPGERRALWDDVMRDVCEQ
jgi:acyl carrier protein